MLRMVFTVIKLIYNRKVLNIFVFTDEIRLNPVLFVDRPHFDLCVHIVFSHYKTV